MFKICPLPTFYALGHKKLAQKGIKLHNDSIVKTRLHHVLDDAALCWCMSLQPTEHLLILCFSLLWSVVNDASQF